MMFRMYLEQSLAENIIFLLRLAEGPHSSVSTFLFLISPRTPLLGLAPSFPALSTQSQLQLKSHHVEQRVQKCSHMKIFNCRSCQQPLTAFSEGHLMVHPLGLLEWGRSPAWFFISPFLIETAISKNLVKKKIQDSGNVVVEYIAVFLSIFLFESVEFGQRLTGVSDVRVLDCEWFIVLE